ncbi:Phage portal protein (plasmid) [Cupriavidus necator]|uniref:Phage portal protein n=1 Tax=Cupriavidus necator TaxID=106590 RepID=A0A1U9V301_CUPNE|nr:phage portal protein [Cupriavidus necator]
MSKGNRCGQNLLARASSKCPRGDAPLLQSMPTGVPYDFPYDAANWGAEEKGNWLPWMPLPDSEINLYRDRVVARTRDLSRSDDLRHGPPDSGRHHRHEPRTRGQPGLPRAGVAFWRSGLRRRLGRQIPAHRRGAVAWVCRKRRSFNERGAATGARRRLPARHPRLRPLPGRQASRRRRLRAGAAASEYHRVHLRHVHLQPLRPGAGAGRGRG